MLIWLYGLELLGLGVSENVLGDGAAIISQSNKHFALLGKLLSNLLLSIRSLAEELLVHLQRLRLLGLVTLLLRVTLVELGDSG